MNKPAGERETIALFEKMRDECRSECIKFLSRSGAAGTDIDTEMAYFMSYIDMSLPDAYKRSLIWRLVAGYVLPVLGGEPESDGHGKTYRERLETIVATCNEKARMISDAGRKANDARQDTWGHAMTNLIIMSEYKAVYTVRAVAARELTEIGIHEASKNDNP